VCQPDWDGRSHTIVCCITSVRHYNSYTKHLIAIYDGAEAKWTKVEGDEFVYYDQTTNEPMPLRTAVDQNYLSDSVQIFGLVFVGISLFIIFVSVVWIFLRREERIVTMSQPQFLYLLCFGAALQAVSLVFVSFDESHGFSDDRLDMACSAFPWFFVIGYLIQYCAVFSKLWRLSKLLSLRRRAVDIKQVLLPFSLIISSSVIILIVWQIVDPLRWEREMISDDEAPLKTYGQCESDNGVLPYVIPLAFLFAVIITMTLAISWKMKDVQSDLSEAKWIFIGIFSHLQIWAIGIPVYLILSGVSRDASYLISMALTFVFANTFVIFVIGPKILQDFRDKFLGGTSTRKTPTLNMSTGPAQMHISGLDPVVSSQSRVSSKFPSNADTQYASRSSTTTYNDEKSKILSLQAEIEDLKSQLSTNESNEPTEMDQEKKLQEKLAKENQLLMQEQPAMEDDTEKREERKNQG
jgi:hypothetical protein